jgi:dTDP-glucose 4,6-dehydratase
VDCRKIRDELGYAPVHDFATGLADTVRWYRERTDWWRPLLAA